MLPSISSPMQLVLGLSLLVLAHAQYSGNNDFFFLGNSFSYYNSFPLRVRRYYEAIYAGIPKEQRPAIRTPRHSPGGANLYTHWQFLAYDDGAPDFTKDIWGWAIIQDQSATPALPDWRSSNNVAARNVAAFAQDGDVPVMFMQTWGYRYGFKKHGIQYKFKNMTQALFEGYDQYVVESSKNGHQAYMAPCGLVFEKVYDDCIAAGKDPEDSDCLWNKLYNKDGYHPSGQGSMLCGMTMAVAMTGLTPYKMNYNPTNNGTVGGQKVQHLFRDAVYRTITETYDSGKIKYPFDVPLEQRDESTIWIDLPDPTPAPEDPTPTPEPTASAAPSSSPTSDPDKLTMFFLGTSSLVNHKFLEVVFQPGYEHQFPDTQVVLSSDSGGELADHYYSTYMDRSVTGSYDMVVLLEATGALSQPSYEPGDFLVQLIEDLGGSQNMFVMPWAFENGNEDQTFLEQTANLLSNTLKLVQEANDAGLEAYMAPVGLAFEVLYLDCEQGLPGCLFNVYRSEKGASKNGQYLAAITLISAMTGLDPDQIDYVAIRMDEGNAEILRDAARRAILYTIVEMHVEYPWDTSEWETMDFTD